MNNFMVTLLERWKEIKRIWTQPPREVRQTAIGWQPDESYIEDQGKTASGGKEYYKIIKGE